MAILHPATLTPTKAELIAAWLPSQGWFDGDASTVVPIGAFRFDDPSARSASSRTSSGPGTVRSTSR